MPFLIISLAYRKSVDRGSPEDLYLQLFPPTDEMFLKISYLHGNSLIGFRTPDQKPWPFLSGPLPEEAAPPLLNMK